MEKINAQLRQININLRKQARVESYAPALSYAPVGSPAAAAAAAAAVPTAGAPAAPAAEPAPAPNSRKEEVLRLLRTGKQNLRSGDNVGACAEFQKALAIAQEIGDVVEEKKAARGVGTSLRPQTRSLCPGPDFKPRPKLFNPCPVVHNT